MSLPLIHTTPSFSAPCVLVWCYTIDQHQVLCKSQSAQLNSTKILGLNGSGNASLLRFLHLTHSVFWTSHRVHTMLGTYPVRSCHHLISSHSVLPLEAVSRSCKVRDMGIKLRDSGATTWFGLLVIQSSITLTCQFSHTLSSAWKLQNLFPGSQAKLYSPTPLRPFSPAHPKVNTNRQTHEWPTF